MRKTFKNEIGITLISLIITIIVLLILAGVSISVLTGYDSIPDNAKTAVDASRQDAEDEQEMINKIGGLFDKYLPITGVYGNLYKISDAEYHLIFNTDGDIAEGYTEAQLVEKSINITHGSGFLTTPEGKEMSTQSWGPYSENIKKVKIEEVIKPRSTAYYFFGLSEITEIEGIRNIDTTNTISMASMFCECKKLTNIDVTGFNTSNVTSIRNLFYGCSSLTSIDVSNFDTSNVTNMAQMFLRCTSLTELDVTNFDTSKVTRMEQMFNNCNKLTSIDVSNFDTSNVTHMSYMFADLTNITSLDISNFDTSNVIDMRDMFVDNYNLNTIFVGDKWSTQVVELSNDMFYGCTKLKGAIAYDSSKTDATYANWETGYLTYKNPFVTTWKVEAGDTITLPIYEMQATDEERGEKETYFNYNFTVDYGDGTVAEIKSFDDADRIHTYAEARRI